ncbi:hypothetical protein [Cupriavidus sp. a3]|uniref:hypothetical protein n=1 Tax=Cupriavidus sp. a3 TaxID=3242158 RepID=UPI003D9C4E64
MADAQNQAGVAQQIVDKSRAMADFLLRELPAGIRTHRVEVVVVDFGGQQRDIVFRSPFGEVWGRFGFRLVQQELHGVLELLKVDRSLDASISLVPLHAMLFDRFGNASFDESNAAGWDWDCEGDIVPEAEAARTFARIMTLKQLDLVRAI